MKISRTAMLLTVPLVLGIGACSRDNDRDALQKDELDRQLDLALQPDSTQQVSFADTATGVDPVPDVKQPPKPTPASPPVPHAAEQS